MPTALRGRTLSKRCACCRAWKALDLFRPDPRRYDGLNSQCVRCSRSAKRPKRPRTNAAPAKVHYLHPELFTPPLVEPAPKAAPKKKPETPTGQVVPFPAATNILVGDALTVLRTLPSESVQCAITSPPYFNQRDYGTGTWAGGDPQCEHKDRPMMSSGSPLRQDGTRLQSGKTPTGNMPMGQVCWRCGAARIDLQIGLEDTPDEYIGRLVEVFRELRRVLKRDATLWVTIGDTYRAKRLLGIPWRLALALQADGWYLRSDVIWSKRNCMPEPVADRCSRSHEYVFLLSKQRRYYYDGDAIREPASSASEKRYRYRFGGEKSEPSRYAVRGMRRTRRQQAEDAARERGLTDAHLAAIRKVGFSLSRKSQQREGSASPEVLALAQEAKDMLGTGFDELQGRDESRNKRSVWSVSTQPVKAAHFAVFPPELVRPMILAGSRPGDTVIDPFCGSGTTLLVAGQEGRRAIGIELNAQYVEMARDRLRRSK